MAGTLAISPERALHAVQEAVRLMNHLCPLLEIDPYELLPEKDLPIKPKLKDFAQNVVLFQQLEQWGKDGFPDKYEAAVLDAFECLDVKTERRTDLGGYGSWLYRGGQLGTFSVVFDFERIENMCKESGKSPETIKFKLFLHELGHFVLHRGSLFSGIAGQAANSAPPELEVEAWLFAHAIVGMVIGDDAYQHKIYQKPDQSFLLL